MALHHDEYLKWPFVTQEEFELACHYFDRIYLGAKLGGTRKAFKVRLRRTLTTGETYIEILRLLQPPEDEDELLLAMSRLGTGDESTNALDTEVNMIEEEEDQVWRFRVENIGWH